MRGLFVGLMLYWALAAIIGLGLTGCFGFEAYGGIRRVDERKVTEVTHDTPSIIGAVTDWLFVDHSKKGDA